MPDKRFVYVLKSADPKPHFYVGLTHDVRARLADHNAGRCLHTARYRPWLLAGLFALSAREERPAVQRHQLFQ